MSLIMLYRFIKMEIAQNIIDFLTRYAILLLSISVHESAHAYSADKLGDSTGKYSGRISLNPLRHIDLIGTVLMPLLQMWYPNAPLIGWAKPCPVNPYNLRDPKRDNMIIAAAGPISNLLFATIVSIIFLFTKNFLYGIPYVANVILQIVILNVVLAVFNMIPMAPLDGGWILEGVMPASWEQTYYSIKPYGFFIVLFLMFTGILWKILGPIVGIILMVLTGIKFI